MKIEQAQKAIAIAGGASAFLTMMSLLLPWVGIFQLLVGFSLLWVVVDVALLAGLTVGVFKRSRVCAVALLVLFVAASGYAVFGTGESGPAGAVFPLVIAILFLRGVQGVFVHHRLKAEREKAAS